MKTNSLNELNSLCSNCKNLYTFLCHYTGLANTDNAISWSTIRDELDMTDTLWEMADQNNMEELDMLDWLKDHLNSSIECSVFQEHSPAGDWPVVKVHCCDMTFFLDWAIE